MSKKKELPQDEEDALQEQIERDAFLDYHEEAHFHHTLSGFLCVLRMYGARSVVDWMPKDDLVELVQEFVEWKKEHTQ